IPSPSSQNLRSAPQKHPKPKIAVSKPSGYGPLSGRPLTKWRDAVGIGSLRPGNAVAALGISSFFLNVNILISLVQSRGGLMLHKHRRPVSHALREPGQSLKSAKVPPVALHQGSSSD